MIDIPEWATVLKSTTTAMLVHDKAATSKFTEVIIFTNATSKTRMVRCEPNDDSRIGGARCAIQDGGNRNDIIAVLPCEFIE